MFRLLFRVHPVVRMIAGLFVILVGVIALVNPAAFSETSGSALGPAILALVLGTLGIISGIVGYIRRQQTGA